MANNVHGYTTNLHLIKSEYNADTWHDNEWYNWDLVDALVGNIMTSLRFKGYWSNNTEYLQGDAIIGDNVIWIVQEDHTTPESGTFYQYYEQHEEYYLSWNGLTESRKWACKMDGLVDDGSEITDYSSKAYAISEGLIPDKSAKEWAATALVSAENAQDWATKTDGTVDGSEYSAKYYAQQAAAIENLKNTAQRTSSLTILGNAANKNYSVNIGVDAGRGDTGSTSLGYQASASGEYAIALGYKAHVYSNKSIQLGSGDIPDGHNKEFWVGFAGDSAVPNYKMLDGTTGKIPNARINMDATPTSASTNTVTSGGVYTALSNKQDTLVSGSNIKTVNGNSLLGSGNITISGGGSYTAGTGIDITGDVISVNGTVQTTGNLVTSISSASTNTQYPSAKCVYDIVGDIETLLGDI